jgi:hypothetical protein
MAEDSKKRRTKIARQKLAMRDSLWPKMDDKQLWMRERSDGWLSIPRAMPLLMQIMDNLSKGKPVSSTYLDLWCRTYDDSFIVANKSREMAFFSGFTGERAERTWASRIRILADLGFIEVAEGPNGAISYVLIYDPYQIVRKHVEKGNINAATFNALKQRMIEIGAQDLVEPEADLTAPRAVKPKPITALLKRPVRAKRSAA